MGQLEFSFGDDEETVEVTETAEPVLPDIHYSNRSTCYEPTRDGTLAAFLPVHNTLNSPAKFNGLAAFRLLESEGWLEPLLSNIRFCWGDGRGDEYYVYMEDGTLEGAEAGLHSGEEGIFDPEELFKKGKPPFEAHDLRREPIPSDK